MAKRHEEMKPKIEKTFDDNYRVYGVHKIWKQMNRQGDAIGRDQVGRLMGELGIEGIRRGKKRKTTQADPTAVRPPDLVDRDFSATRPDQLWVTDFTYVPTWSGFAYAAFVIDVFSRMIVGWRVATSMTTDLVLDTLEMALWRRDERVAGVICHSDQRVVKADSTGRRNTSTMEVGVGRRSGWVAASAGRPAVRKRNRQKDVRIYRGQIPSPGAPTVAWREDRVRFWAAIASGLKTDEAGAEAGVSSPSRTGGSVTLGA